MTDYIRTFNRYELKYLLHHRQAWDLMDSIRGFVRTDPNAVKPMTQLVVLATAIGLAAWQFFDPDVAELNQA